MPNPWLRLMIRYGLLVANELQSAYELAAQFDVQTDFGARRVVVEFNRLSKGGLDEDTAQFSLVLVNFTNELPDDTWTDADFGRVESYMDDIWTALKGFYAPQIALQGYRWYREGKDADPPNPAVRFMPRNVPGTSTSPPLPPQVAVSVTFRTGVRKRWGRVYLPQPSVGHLDTGNLDANFVDAVADTWEAALGGLAGEDFHPVVWSPTTETMLGIETLQVDDLPDVIRSRRYDKPTLRDRRPVA